MTTVETKAVKTAILVAATLALLGMAWNAKASTSDVDELRSIVLDHLCTDYPTHRRCQ